MVLSFLCCGCCKSKTIAPSPSSPTPPTSLSAITVQHLPSAASSPTQGPAPANPKAFALNTASAVSTRLTIKAPEKKKLSLTPVRILQIDPNQRITQYGSMHYLQLETQNNDHAMGFYDFVRFFKGQEFKQEAIALIFDRSFTILGMSSAGLESLGKPDKVIMSKISDILPRSLFYPSEGSKESSLKSIKMADYFDKEITKDSKTPFLMASIDFPGNAVTTATQNPAKAHLYVFKLEPYYGAIIHKTSQLANFAFKESIKRFLTESDYAETLNRESVDSRFSWHSNVCCLESEYAGELTGSLLKEQVDRLRFQPMFEETMGMIIHNGELNIVALTKNCKAITTYEPNEMLGECIEIFLSGIRAAICHEAPESMKTSDIGSPKCQTRRMNLRLKSTLHPVQLLDVQVSIYPSALYSLVLIDGHVKSHEHSRSQSSSSDSFLSPHTLNEGLAKDSPPLPPLSTARISNSSTLLLSPDRYVVSPHSDLSSNAANSSPPTAGRSPHSLGTSSSPRAPIFLRSQIRSTMARRGTAPHLEQIEEDDMAKGLKSRQKSKEKDIVAAAVSTAAAASASVFSNISKNQTL